MRPTARRDDVRAIAVRRAGVAGADRIGDQHERGRVHQRPGHAHDLFAVAGDRHREQREAAEHDQRAEGPELLARVLGLPDVRAEDHVADPLWQVDDQLLAGGVVHPLEREVRAVGRVGVLRGLELLQVLIRGLVPDHRNEGHDQHHAGGREGERAQTALARERRVQHDRRRRAGEEPADVRAGRHRDQAAGDHRKQRGELAALPEHRAAEDDQPLGEVHDRLLVQEAREEDVGGLERQEPGREIAPRGRRRARRPRRSAMRSRSSRT